MAFRLILFPIEFLSPEKNLTKKHRINKKPVIYVTIDGLNNPQRLLTLNVEQINNIQWK